MIFPVRFVRMTLAAPLFLAWLPALPRQEAAAPEEFAKGVVIENVVCQADKEQSYALYLPSAYDNRRAWPIIFCFDPRANGKNPVGCFRQAAEEFGCIVVGSNNSRNGPWEPSQKAIGAMVADTRSRFNIDSRRIYSAGHSGGAHVALLFPRVLRTPAVAGVIACCNGLPPAISLADYPKDLAVVAATGINDFNYWPTRKIGPALEAAGIARRVLVFDGEHQWPPAEAAREALAWLELQAMKTGRRESDESWIRSFFTDALERTKKIESGGRLADAFLEYSALAADFHGVCDVLAAESARERLQNSSEVKKFPEVARAAEEREGRRFREIEQMVSAILQSGDADERRANERKLRNSLPAPESRPFETSRLAFNPRRPLHLAYAEILNAAARELNAEKMKSAAPLYEIAAIIRPEEPVAWYNLTFIYTRNGEIKKALSALENTLASGRVDPEAIERDPDFAPLRQEAAYAGILEKARSKREAEKK